MPTDDDNDDDETAVDISNSSGSSKDHKPATVGAPASLTAASAESSPEATAKSMALVEQSDASYTAGEHAAALRHALAALQADGQCADAHRASGRALYALGRVDAAERAWAKANALSSLSQPTPAAVATDPKPDQRKATASSAAATEMRAPPAAASSTTARAAAAEDCAEDCEGDGSDLSSIEDDGVGEEGQEKEEGGESEGESEDEGEGQGEGKGKGQGGAAAACADADAETTVRLADYANKTDALLVGALLNAYASDPLGDGKPLPPEIPATLASKLAGVPGAFSVLAFVGGQPAGLVNVFQGFSTFKARPLLNVHDCYVAEFARGQGVCGKMLAEVEREAKRRACCKVTLEVLSNNAPAKKAYTRFGFEPYVLDPEAGPAQFWQKAVA